MDGADQFLNRIATQTKTKSQKDLLAAKQFLANALLLVERFMKTCDAQSYDAQVIGPMKHEIKTLIKHIERIA
jgi:hypothetical protein